MGCIVPVIPYHDAGKNKTEDCDGGLSKYCRLFSSVFLLLLLFRRTSQREDSALTARLDAFEKA